MKGRTYTVIVDDDCGTDRVYLVDAETPNSAAAYATRIYNSHSSMTGQPVMVFVGEPQKGCFWQRRDLTDPNNVIDLRVTPADLVI
jgi:hypothetical protein